ncbi:hypothetical protein GCM10018987_47890 [Streptomyces cremeus]
MIGELSVAAFPTAARGLLPPALAALRDRHPGLRVKMREVEPDAAVRGVVRGDYDVAVVLDWYNKPLSMPAGLAKRELLDDPADVAMPVGHRLAGRDEVDLAEFAGDDWVTWAEGEFCHEWLLLTLRGVGVEPRLAHVAEEHATQLALVEAGLGVCVAPRLGRGPVPDGVSVVPVRHAMRRHVYAVWRADADRRPSIRAAVGALAAAGEAGGELSPGARVTGRPVCGSPRRRRRPGSGAARRGRPSCGISVRPKYFWVNIRSGASSSGQGSPVRGASPTKTAVPESSMPRRSPYSTPSSTTTATRGSLRSWAQRRLRVIEYSHSEAPSQTNHRAPMCGAPSAETVGDPAGALLAEVGVAFGGGHHDAAAAALGVGAVGHRGSLGRILMSCQV